MSISKFLSLGKLAFLLERLKRTLDFSSTTIKDVTLENPTATGTVTGFGGGATGDITTVTAGTLLDGGGTSGDVTLNVDLTEAGEAAIANGDYILFLDGGATGAHAKEAVHDLATLFAGTGLTATNSVIAVDVAQSGITSLGTLTALTVDDIAINGKVITMTGSDSDTTTITAGTNGTLTIVTTDDAAAAANIQITADGTAELAGTTVTLDSAGDVNIESDALNIGNDGDTDVTVTFKGNSSDGVVKWMEDEDEFQFSDSVRGKFIHFTQHSFNKNSGTSLIYIPINSTVDQAGFEEYANWMAPYDGKLLKVMIRPAGYSGNYGGSTVVGLHINRNASAATTVTQTLSSDATVTYTFSSSNTFSAGNLLALSMDVSTAPGDINLCAVWEFDSTT